MTTVKDGWRHRVIKHDDDETTRMRKGSGGTTKGAVVVGDYEPHEEPIGRLRSTEKLHAAARTAEKCGWCDEPLGPGQPIWQWVEPIDAPDLVRIVDGYEQGMAVYSGETICVPFCEVCADDFELRTMKVEPCVGCGRIVHLTPKSGVNWLKRGKKAFCSEDCMSKPEIVQPGLPTRTCASAGCERRFAPKRLDAQYCSPACRQKSFREAKKVLAP
jgi:hypothetical protein